MNESFKSVIYDYFKFLPANKEIQSRDMRKLARRDTWSLHPVIGKENESNLVVFERIRVEASPNYQFAAYFCLADQLEVTAYIPDTVQLISFVRDVRPLLERTP